MGVGWCFRVGGIQSSEFGVQASGVSAYVGFRVAVGVEGFVAV